MYFLNYVDRNAIAQARLNNLEEDLGMSGNDFNTCVSMYVAGVGGTGKSYVVKAVLRLFTLLGRRGEVMVSAPTGAAAILIGGYTVHSLLMLPDREGIDLQPLVVLWAGVYYLIVDEVSMISASFMNEISARLQHAKGNSGLSEDIPFGGVNMIFFGDFGQLRPVGGAPLYSHQYTEALQVGLQDSQTSCVCSCSPAVQLLYRQLSAMVCRGF